jgi:phosphate transport system ATP-binding protein
MNVQTSEPAETAVMPLPQDRVKVAVEDLDFFYGQAQALHGVSLGVARNAVTALIGPSGCGKSTLLRTLNRMYSLYPGQRAQGRVLLDGEDVLAPRSDLSALRARVGMVFQKPTPFPMSIFDNVAYGVRLYERLPKTDLADRVEDSLRRAALWDEVKDKLKASGLSLSGGQQQRLCVARAIAVKPEVLLLDEPCSALDPRSTTIIEELILDLREELAVVIVTHNLQQAYRIADRVAFMFLGELVEYGPAEDVFERPRHTRTADYVGGAFG